MSTKIKAIGVGFALAILCFNPDLANAASATDIKGMAEKAEGNIKAVKSLAISLFYMIGVFLFGAGLFLIYKDQKQPNQGHAKNGAISIFVGVALLLIPSLVNVASNSIGVTGDAAGTALKSDKAF